MIQPTNKLPWREGLSKNRKKYQIRDRNDILVVDNVYSLADAMYIEQCCNNFPKAIELLKSLAPLEGSKVYNFLKSIG